MKKVTTKINTIHSNSVTKCLNNVENLALMFQNGVFFVYLCEIARYVEEFLIKIKSGSARIIIRCFSNYTTLTKVAGL